MSKSIYLLALMPAAVPLAVHAFFTSAHAQEQSVEMTVLADQIRSQGFACSDRSRRS
jgi:hypothetical protein